MSYLRQVKFYVIIKVAGDNAPPGTPDSPDMFVANNRIYDSGLEAGLEARRLSKLTPENRYYVAESKGGYLSTAPKTSVVSH